MILKVLLATAVTGAIILRAAAFFRAGIIKLMLSTAGGTVPNVSEVLDGALPNLPCCSQ